MRALAIINALLGAMAPIFGFAAYAAADRGRPFVAIQATVLTMLALLGILL